MAVANEMSEADNFTSLMDQACSLLDEGDLEAASAIGDELCRQCFSGGFEILARCHIARHDSVKAIEVLNEGVMRAPDVWILWMLLGNQHSDQGEFDAAGKAYARALECPNPDHGQIRLNQAIALHRQDRFEEALSLLDSLPRNDSSLHARAVTESMAVLRQMGDMAKAVRLGRRALEHMPDDCEEEYLALLKAELATVLWTMGGQYDAVIELAEDAISLDRNCRQALWLIREVENEKDPNARYFRILIEGTVDGPHDTPDGCSSFFSSCDVVAINPMDGLDRIRRFEHPSIAHTLAIDECEDMGPRPDEPMGVYRMSKRIWFQDDDDEVNDF